MNKFELEKENFCSRFKFAKNMKIALYGTGRLTATLIELLDEEWNIIGLCDREVSLLGKVVYGKKILSQNEVETNADILIINTVRAYWEAIYNRIKDWNIDIYFNNGERAVINNSNIEELEYWNESLEQLYGAVDTADVICFDLFDTILMRKLYMPTDIFRVVQKKLDIDIDFVNIRNMAAAKLDNPSFDEIYEQIIKDTNIDEKIVGKIKNIEIETELEFLTPRAVMVNLFNQCIHEKEVFIVSDMYFNASQLSFFLRHFGVCIDENRIIASCDYKTSKREKLWKLISNMHPGKSMVHIGDDLIGDYEMPKKYNIDSYKIMNASEMLASSSIREIIPYISNCACSYTMGNIMNELFNNPYALNNTRGKIKFVSYDQMGYCLFGPMVANFINWLLEKSTENRNDQLIFFSRDGYLVKSLYDYYVEINNIEDAPVAKCMEIPRQDIVLFDVETAEDIKRNLLRLPFEGTLRQLINNRYDIDIITDEELNQDISVFKNQTEKFDRIVAKYEAIIYKRVRQIKNNYCKYVDGFNITERSACVDLIGQGTKQHYLSSILNKIIKGYYCIAWLEDKNEYYVQNNVFACFQRDDDLTGKNTSIFKHLLLLESEFDTPHGMIKYITADGELIYSKPMESQNKFLVREMFFKGMKRYLDDTALIKKNEHDALFVEKLYDVFINNGLDICEDDNTAISDSRK